MKIQERISLIRFIEFYRILYIIKHDLSVYLISISSYLLTFSKINSLITSSKVIPDFSSGHFSILIGHLLYYT